jgi:hypothetical protein
MKFLDVKTDLAFKKVFASEESKDILASFICPKSSLHFFPIIINFDNRKP